MSFFNPLYDTTPQGAKRQHESGALIFPVHPRELKAEQQRADLDRELEEVRVLKKELEELKKELRGE